MPKLLQNRTMHVFGIVLTLAVTCMHVYVFFRAGTLPIVKRTVPPEVVITAGMVLWFVFVAGRTFGHGESGIFAGVLELCGMTWMAVVFLLFMLIFAADILTGFGFFLPRANAILRGTAVAAGLILSVIGLYQGMRQPVIRQYELSIPGLAANLDGKTIAAVSDLHIESAFRKKWLSGVAGKIRSLKPDMVVFVGDIFEGHQKPDREIQNVLNRIEAPFGVWGVLGNHEFYGGLHRNTHLLEPCGIQFLRNRWIEPVPGLIVAGVDDLSVGRHFNKKNGFLHQSLKDRPEGTTILLSHTPEGIETAAGLGVDLMLCGHTHGGQIWPFGYLVKLRYPFLAGLYKTDGMRLVVSRGAGTWGARMRLWHPNEIVRIVLHSEDRV
ncbi:MAG: metallophosphoesterase [Desulfarculaceae bacterium]|nr:metallophosphoesterase [Desulfarculaceae bacterium]